MSKPKQTNNNMLFLCPESPPILNHNDITCRDCVFYWYQQQQHPMQNNAPWPTHSEGKTDAILLLPTQSRTASTTDLDKDDLDVGLSKGHM